MGFSLKSLGKSISNAFKGVGKTLQKAAPVLIPLALAGVTGGFSSGGYMGQIAKSLFGGSNMGAIGKNLLGGLAKTGLAKTTVDSAMGGVTADTVAQETGANKGSGNLIGGLLQKAIPTLLTQAIEGKPKSASKEAASLYAAAPTMTPAQSEMANLIGSRLKDDLNNQEKISPLSTNTRDRISFGAPMQASAPNNPLAPVAPSGVQTGGQIGAFSAPVSSLSPEEIAARRNRPRGYAVRGGM